MGLVDPYLLCGKTIKARYHIERLLAAGGMGLVYQAIQVPGGRPCALKLCKPAEQLGDKAQIYQLRFRREALLGLSVQVEGLVTIYDFDTLPDGSMYCAMELLSGCDLHRFLAEAGPLPWEEAVEIALQAAQTFAALHRCGVVHRDIKPENLQILQDGRVKVFDLGAACSEEVPIGPDDVTDIRTETGQALGTPPYMAPEQLLDSSRADERSDVYGLALVLYEMITGQQPFRQQPLPRVLQMKFLPQPVPPLRTCCPQAPPALEQALLRALAPHERRTASMNDFAEALELVVPSPRQRLRQSLAERVQGLGQGRPRPAAPPPTLSVPSPLPTTRPHRGRLWPAGVVAFCSLSAGMGLAHFQLVHQQAPRALRAAPPVLAAPPVAQAAVTVTPIVPRAARPVRAAPREAPGRVRVLVRPFAEIYIDGAYRAEGCPYTYALSPGVHRVRALNAAVGRDETRVVHVESGGLAEVRLDWGAP